MKRQFLLLISALGFISLNSCSPYKNSTTTPDDVYYSPGIPVEKTVTNTTNSDYYSTPNENYVKMRVQDPDRWSYFDDYNYDYYGSGFSPYSPYGYSPYGYGSGIGLSIGFGTGFYSPWYGGFGYYSPLSYYNSYYAWNNFYNPYYGGVVIVNGKNTTTPSYTRMSNFNPSAYQGRYYNARPTTLTNTRTSQFYNSNPNSNYNRSTNSRPSYFNSSPMRSPSNFGGGGSGGGASHSGGFSRPGR
jgi:hypothetical protein